VTVVAALMVGGGGGDGSGTRRHVVLVVVFFGYCHHPIPPGFHLLPDDSFHSHRCRWHAVLWKRQRSVQHI
jgi:hypothetical protein